MRRLLNLFDTGCGLQDCNDVVQNLNDLTDDLKKLML